jgi:hypothetical protein
MKYIKTLPFVLGFFFFSFLLFTSCENSESSNGLQNGNTEKILNNSYENGKQDLILETLFFYSLSELEEKFGSSNVRNEFNEACETCGPEGTPSYENTYTTTIFPNLNKEVNIEWNSRKTRVTEVSVSLNGSEWRTKEGFHLGDSISEINHYFKNKPVKLTYVNWFYYKVNDNYTLMFNSDNLNYDVLDTENLQSNDTNLKNLVLVGISIKLPEE